MATYRSYMSCLSTFCSLGIWVFILILRLKIQMPYNYLIDASEFKKETSSANCIAD